MKRAQLRNFIGFGLLWIFTIPQFSNVVHFWVITHDFSIRATPEKQFVNKTQVHYCDQTLFKVSPFFVHEFFLSLDKILHVQKQVFSLNGIKLIENFFFGCYLRGPPNGKG